jgi:7-keto-8-aminopelargonate synthetase-like enzyme
MNQVTALKESFLQKFQYGKELGIIHTVSEDTVMNGHQVTLNGKQYCFFGNCSYLGIESDERVKYQSVEATLKYGTSFSSSRTYISLNYLQQAEEKLQQIFGQPTLVAQTTWLGHIALIPLLATRGDVIILDHQVHTSVQSAVQIAKANGVHVELIRHNRMDLLEEKINTLEKQYNKIWYMADGIYSIYGDGAPLKELVGLLNKYEQFYLYVDDAHGMSWAGVNGRGYVLDQIDYHPKMCLATSLAKGFGATAAALVFPNEQMKEIVKLSGSPFIFSNPPSPGTLGAIMGSADIHLSEEIYSRQQKLRNLMVHFIDTCHLLNLPLVKEDLTPVFYIGVSHKNSIVADVVKDIMEQGFFVNTCSYPSVPLKNEGVRISLTTHQTKENITALLHAIAGILEKYGVTKEAFLLSFETKNEKEPVAA